MTNLIWAGKQLNTLEDLRDHFDLDEAMVAFTTGEMEKWLTDRYYDPQAEALSDLEHIINIPIAREVCAALGVPYPKTHDMTPKEKDRYERNLNVLRRYTDDAEALDNADALAENQSELAELLDAGKTTICLCAGSFTVPLRKNGIRYLLIGQPTLNDAYSPEQYHEVGIELVAVTSSIASEQRELCDNPLAEYLRQTLASDRVQKKLDITAEQDQTYRSREEAQEAAKEIVSRLYQQATAYFDPYSGTCIADVTASEYAHILKTKISGLMNIIRDNDTNEADIEQIDNLVSRAEAELKDSFLKDMDENSDFYRPYCKSYFMNRLMVKATPTCFDPLMDIADAIEEGVNHFFDGVISVLEKLQGRLDDKEDVKEGPDGMDCEEMNENTDESESEYYIAGLDSVIEELQEDVDSRANAFYTAAHEQYKKYSEKIERLVESLNLPEGIMTRLNATA